MEKKTEKQKKYKHKNLQTYKQLIIMMIHHWMTLRLQVDYNNNTSVTDPVLVKKFKTIKEDENDDIEVIKTIQRVVISDDDDDNDVEFFEKNALTSWGQVQTFREEIFTNITKKNKKLTQRSKNQSKEIEYIKKVLLHPSERLKRKNRLKDEPELKYFKPVPSHSRD